MSASIVVEDGSGKTDSNSYISTTTGDAILEELYLLMGLDSAPTLNDIDCIAGTQFIDTMFHNLWKGTRVDREQALDFPRVNVEDDDGYYYDSDDIPADLERATAIYAYYAQTDGANIIPNLTNEGTIKKEEKKAGPISKMVEYTTGSTARKIYSLAEKELDQLIEESCFARRI